MKIGNKNMEKRGEEKIQNSENTKIIIYRKVFPKIRLLKRESGKVNIKVSQKVSE